MYRCISARCYHRTLGGSSRTTITPRANHCLFRGEKVVLRGLGGNPPCKFGEVFGRSVMKRINGLYLLGVVVVFVTIGCAGTRGGGGLTTLTPAGTAVSMATIKGLMYGTAPPGSQVSFNLNGSDSQGYSWTGSYAVMSDGPTTFESQNVALSRTLLTLKKGSGTPITLISSRYYLI